MILEDVAGNRRTANEHVNEYRNEETEQVEKHLQNERNNTNRSHESRRTD